MKYNIYFSDGATWPNPKTCLQEDIPETVKQSIIDAYYYLTVELTKKDALNRITAIRNHINEN